MFQSPLQANRTTILVNNNWSKIMEIKLNKVLVFNCRMYFLQSCSNFPPQNKENTQPPFVAPAQIITDDDTGRVEKTYSTF